MPHNDPIWIDDLCDALGHGAFAQSIVLPPAAALEELRLVADAATAGRAPNASDVRSLRADLTASLDALGPAVGEGLSPVLEHLRREVRQLAKALRDPAAAAAPAVSARTALELLQARSMLVRAWHDAVDAFAAPRSLDEQDRRSACLADLLRLAGEQPRDVLDLMREVLLNRPYGLVVVNAYLGRPAPVDDDFRAQPLALEARMALVRDFIEQRPEWKPRVVWLVFVNAVMPRGYVRIGPVSFFDVRIWSQIAPGVEVPELGGDEPPAELVAEWDPPPISEDGEDADPFSAMPDEQLVLARVAVPAAWADKSPQFVRRMVRHVVELAYPATEWKLLDGAITFEEGQPPRSDLATATELSRWPALLALDTTGAGLPALTEEIVDMLASGRADAEDLADVVAWNAAVSRLPDAAQRIGLGLRTLEGSLPPDLDLDGWSWRTATERFLFVPWRDQSMIDHTLFVLRLAAQRTSLGGRHLGALQERIDSARSGDPRVLTLALEVIPALLSALPEGSVAKRHIERLQQRLTEHRAAWGDELRAVFLTLLMRAVRHRNAVLHAGPVARTAMESADGFIARLAGMIGEFRMFALLRDTTMLELLEWVRTRSTLGTWSALDGS